MILKSALIILFCLTSCATQKQKQAYLLKRIKALEKYSTLGVIEANIDSRIYNLSKKNKRQIKKSMNIIERYVALNPDSTENNNQSIDSFYTNFYKVKYIKKYRLMTAKKHCVNHP